MDVDWLGPHEPVVVAMVALLAPHLEAVAHDVDRDRVVAVWNPLSGRRVGDESLLEPELLATARDGTIYGPYAKVDAQGGRWTSVSVSLADGRGLLCLNFDRSALDSAAAALTRFATAVEPRPAALFERDWREEINVLVDEWCQVARVPRARLTSGQRREVVGMLDGKGLFAMRHAAVQVAAALNVSRATVYSLLKTSRAVSSDSATAAASSVEKSG